MVTDILELRNISHQYNGRPVLQVPSFRVPAGAITGLVGPNGSGKSTLLKILGFVEKCTAGQVLFQGEPAEPFNRRVRFRVSLLTQEPYLLKRSVFDNIAYGLKIRRQGNNLRDAVFAALELVGLDSSFARRQWYELSGGEAQRIALAARLALKPNCLLLDEPTASVDIQSAEKIRQAVLMARAEWRTTIVIASHNPTWLHTICDKLVYLFNGRLYDSGLENILFGPWEKLTGNRFGRRIGPDRVLVVTVPPHQEKSCIIHPEAIILSDSNKDTGAENRLQGKILSVFKENHTETIMALVACDDLCFTVNLITARLPKGKWFPGHEVTLEFAAEDVIWLPT
jgi:tungstate transport system ATP-binding protein